MTLLVPAALGLMAGAAIAASGGGAGRDRDRIPVAVPDGPARNCVSIALLRESVVRSDRVIDFVTGNHRAYRVVLPQDCPELGFEQRFAYETSLSELCSTDIITVLHEAPLSRGASCGLAKFQPVILPHR
ncbi:hypothetical protein [Sphingomonas bacterium]|uniref:hypothetical protein n=1 Tax=Sphingomonas bacterium TaxID=1895847 RepID=UPI0020C67280|nr:hypothetical protein [Sphingomonas bacterium]